MPPEPNVRIGLTTHALHLVHELHAQAGHDPVISSQPDGEGLVWVDSQVLEGLLCAARAHVLPAKELHAV